jgi:hypothetical protein
VALSDKPASGPGQSLPLLLDVAFQNPDLEGRLPWHPVWSSLAGLPLPKSLKSGRELLPDDRPGLH